MIFQYLQPLAQTIVDNDGRLHLVGGRVRDHFLKLYREYPSTNGEEGDCDLVVSGMGLENCLEIAARFGPARIISHRGTFNHIKEPTIIQLRLNDTLLEISPTRSLCSDNNGGLPGDALARDYTLNAIYLDPLTDAVFDPLGGLADLKRGWLRPCHDQALIVDPLRMLRGMGLISRFALSPTHQLLAVIKRDLTGLAQVPSDRFWPEWRKWAVSAQPHLGLDFLHDSGILGFWPQLAALERIPQNPRFHPEGDVWCHTVRAVEIMANLPIETDIRRVKLILATLLHDLGKQSVTTLHEGKLISRGHAQAGLPLAEDFLRSIKAPHPLWAPILKLIDHHMDLRPQSITPKALRRLARHLAPECDLADYWALSVADWNGRGPAIEPFPLSLDEFLAPVANLPHPRPPFLQGRDLINQFNLPPGPIFSRILRRLDEAADDGLIKDRLEALALAPQIIAEESNCLER